MWQRNCFAARDRQALARLRPVAYRKRAMPRTDTDAFALGAAHYEDVVTVRDFMTEKVRPVIQRFANNDHGDGTVYGLFLRGLGWLATLAELRHPQHFQAALAGTRTLLELCVDLSLLHHDRAKLTPAMIVAWERSAKLKAAERTKRCFEGRAIPEEHQERLAFIDREGDSIRAERASVWPGRTKPHSHPERWTDRSLDRDAQSADAFGGYGLRDYYDGRYAELCWGTHGSGLAGVRSIPESHFPAIVAFAFQDAARLGTLASELALRYFNKFDSILEERFKQLEKDRVHWRALGWAKAKGYIE